MNVEKFTNEIKRRQYIVTFISPEVLSILSRQQGDKLGLLKKTELWSIKNEVSNRK